MSKIHLSRGWYGLTDIEKDCPCPKAACGLAEPETGSTCEHHGMLSGKTIRNAHLEGDCPQADSPVACHCRGKAPSGIMHDPRGCFDLVEMVEYSTIGEHLVRRNVKLVKDGMWEFVDG